MASERRSATGCAPVAGAMFNATAKANRTMAPPPGMVRAMIVSPARANSTRMRFEIGPASVVRLSSRTIFLKLRVMTGRGLGPANEHEGNAEADEWTKDHHGGKKQRTDGIDVGQRVERDAPLEPGRLIAESRSHPGMCALMKTERKKQQNKLENGNDEAFGLQWTSPGARPSVAR